MKRFIYLLMIVVLCMGTNLHADEEPGQAAQESKVSASALTWGILGVGLLVAIGIVIAIALSNDNNNKVIIVQH